MSYAGPPAGGELSPPVLRGLMKDYRNVCSVYVAISAVCGWIHGPRQGFSSCGGWMGSIRRRLIRWEARGDSRLSTDANNATFWLLTSSQSMYPVPVSAAAPLFLTGESSESAIQNSDFPRLPQHSRVALQFSGHLSQAKANSCLFLPVALL